MSRDRIWPCVVIEFRYQSYKTFCSPVRGTTGPLLDYQFQTAVGFHLVMIAAATIHESRQDLLDLVVDILIKSQALAKWQNLGALVPESVSTTTIMPL